MTYKELGKLLRKARLAKKWRFRDLEQRTKINVTFIKAMENGDFDFLPKPYVKAFIRAYATEVELDVQEVIKHFEASHPETQSPSAATRKKQNNIEANKKDIKEPIQISKESPAISKPETELNSVNKKTSSKESAQAVTTVPSKKAPRCILRQHRSTIFFSVLLGLLLTIIVTIYLKYGRYYFFPQRKEVKKISIFEAAKELQTAPKPDSSITPLELTKASLRVRAQKTTWMRVIKDGVDTLEFLFQPGDKMKLEAQHSLKLKIGRADGLMLWVNGDSIGVLGPGGKIVDPLLITPAGIVEEKLRRPLPIQAPKSSPPESTRTTEVLE